MIRLGAIGISWGTMGEEDQPGSLAHSHQQDLIAAPRGGGALY